MTENKVETPEELMELFKNDPIKVAMYSGMVSRVPVCLIGDPGTTKTAFINYITSVMGYDLITIILSRSEATDISGYPTKGEMKITRANGEKELVPVTEYAPQVWQHEVMNNPKTVVFFDEFSNTPPPTRASSLTTIQDRVFPDGSEFPKETIILLAMNPINSAPNGMDLDPATTNRMMFLPWMPPISEWLEGMRDDWGKKDLPENEVKWRNLIIRYIRENPSALHDIDVMLNPSSDGTPEVFGVAANDEASRTVMAYAWPSRRSWNHLSRALGAMTFSSHIAEDIIGQGLIGFSGMGNFRDWLRKNSSINVKDILKNPESFQDWDNLSVDDFNLLMRQASDTMETIEDADNFSNLLVVISNTALASQVSPHIIDATKKMGTIFRENSGNSKITESKKKANEAIKLFNGYLQDRKKKA